MNAAGRWLIAGAVCALLLGTVVTGIVLVGTRAPAAGERLPCGHLAYRVFELGGVTKAVCVKGHAWTRFQGRWVSASDPLAAPAPRPTPAPGTAAGTR